jgi:hypothetical protein
MLDAIATFYGDILRLLVYGPIAVAVLFFAVGFILGFTFTITVYLSYHIIEWHMIRILVM